MLASLALLPVDMISDGFLEVMADSPNDPAVIQFNDYFVAQWMENPAIGFSWSCAGETHRTTNFIESWHHRVNSHFNSANPNFYSVLSFYRDEERLAYVKLLCMINVNLMLRERSGILLRICIWPTI